MHTSLFSRFAGLSFVLTILAVGCGGVELQSSEDDSHFEEATILPWSTTVEYTFTGVLNEPFGTLSVGTPFSGSFSYNRLQKNSVMAIPPDPVLYGGYHYKTVSLTFGAETVSDNTSSIWDLKVFNDYPGRDSLDLSPLAMDGSLGGLTLNHSGGIYIRLADSTAKLWSTLALPGPELTMANFPSASSTTKIWLNSEGPRIISASGSIQTLTGKLVP